MKTKTVTHESGVVEFRTYDNSGRLVEIRKKLPVDASKKPVILSHRSPAYIMRD